MKIRLYVSIFIICFFSGNIASAKSWSDFTGTDWNALSIETKALFIGGFIAGTSHVFFDEMDLFREDTSKYFETEKKVSLSKRIHAKNRRQRNFTQDEIIFWGDYRSGLRTIFLKRHLIEISAEQVVNGLNAFYQDYKNSDITIPDAIYVVQQQIKGLSEKDNEEWLLYLRSGKKKPRPIFNQK